MDDRPHYGGAHEAAGGLSRPQRGNPRRGFPLYLLLLSLIHICIALILAIIGGLNWGSIGLFRFDIVAWLFGGQTATVSRVVYALVGKIRREKVVVCLLT